MPLFRYSLPSLSGTLGSHLSPSFLLPLHPLDHPQAAEAWEEQKEEKRGFLRLWTVP